MTSLDRLLLLITGLLAAYQVAVGIDGLASLPMIAYSIAFGVLLVAGLLLSFLKAGRPILSREAILKILPGLLLLMTACFVVGFKFG